MSQFKIRCSSIGKIMTEPRTKSELLSETAKTYIREQWIADKYGRHKEFSSNAIKKGLANEEDGISMLSFHLDEFLTKNKETKENDFIKGTCDIIHNYCIYDIKCPYDLFNFSKAEVTKDYWWQLQGYCELFSMNKACLVYVLTNTPASIIENEVRSIIYKMPSIDVDAMEIQAMVTKQLTFDDIDDMDKVKLFYFEHDQEAINKLKEKHKIASDYYNSLTL